MKELAKQGTVAQAKLDEQLAEEATPLPPLPSWKAWWASSETIRNNPIAKINAFQSKNHLDFLAEVHKNCNSDCKAK
jgi:hypothetical protein